MSNFIIKTTTTILKQKWIEVQIFLKEMKKLAHEIWNEEEKEKKLLIFCYNNLGLRSLAKMV